MIRGLCDDWRRLPARLYSALEVACPCCTAYRFALLFAALGALWGFTFAAILFLSGPSMPAATTGPVPLTNRVPDAFKDSSVPPPMPAKHSPLQQQARAAAARAADEAKTPAEELAELFPVELEVTVHKLIGRDPETGRKLRERITVYIEQATLEEWGGLLVPLDPLVQSMTNNEALPLNDILGKYRPAIVTGMSAATGVEEDVIRNLRGPDLLLIVEAFIKVNRELFMARLPALGMMMAAMVGGLQGGPTSSPSFAASASPTPTA